MVAQQPALAPAAVEGLRARYEAYCAEQAAALPALLPREGLRALYRSARADAAGDRTDPLALLVARCRALLPLPPFEAWAADYLRDSRPYHDPPETGTVGRVRSTPVTVDTRPVEHAGTLWVAALALFREPPDWRGYIAFHCADAGGAPPVHRTADVFVETRAEDVRRRFRAFSSETLQAFLRSTLP